MTTTTPTRAQDLALASLIRQARSAIKHCERDLEDYGQADFNEQLAARESYHAKVSLCLWWIRYGKEHGDE